MESTAAAKPAVPTQEYTKIAQEETHTQEKKMKNKEKLEAKATQLVDLIDYQEGSVVSRTIIDKEAGTVTLFAFDEGQGLSEHTAPSDAMVHVLEGDAKVT